MLPWYAPSHQRTQLELMKEQARSSSPPGRPSLTTSRRRATWMERYTLEVSGRGACNYDFGLLSG